MHLTHIISLLLSLTLLPNLALAGLMDCQPTAGKHTVGYQSSRAGEDIIIDVFDPNCKPIMDTHHIPHRPKGAKVPTRFVLKIPGWANWIEISWEKGWNSMHGPTVTFDRKVYQPESCATKGDDSACTTTF